MQIALYLLMSGQPSGEMGLVPKLALFPFPRIPLSKTKMQFYAVRSAISLLIMPCIACGFPHLSLHTLMGWPSDCIDICFYACWLYTSLYLWPITSNKAQGVDIRHRELVTGRSFIAGNLFSRWAESIGFVLTSVRVTEVDLKQKCGEASGNDQFLSHTYMRQLENRQ